MSDQTTSGVRGIGDVTKSISEVAFAVDRLVVLTRAGLKRSILLIVFCGILLAISTMAILFLLLRVSSQTSRLDDLASKLSAISEEQIKTRWVTEQTKEKVETAAQAAEDKPTVEIRPATSASGKPQAVVVIKARANPKASAASPAPPSIEIPIKLPEGSQLEPTDAGAKK